MYSTTVCYSTMCSTTVICLLKYMSFIYHVIIDYCVVYELTIVWLKFGVLL